jgi:HlyD family secretion protein
MGRLKVLLIFLIVVIGIAVAFFGPLILREPVRKKTVEEKKPIAPSVIVAKGVVVSQKEAEISSKVVGLIRKILVSENEYVTKGQPLVVLDDEEIRAQIREAEALKIKATADYEKALEDYKRYERLYKNDVVTLSMFEEFKRRLEFGRGELLRTEAQLARAKALLKNYTLKSPINGVVIRKHLEVGEMANVGVPILTLADINSLKIKTELDETDVGKVYIGQKADVTTDAYPDRVYTGIVEKISEDVKRKRVRTFDPLAWMDINSQEVTILLDSFDGLKIGMTVEVRFYLTQKTHSGLANGM